MDTNTAKRQHFRELVDALSDEHLNLLLDYMYYLKGEPLALERLEELRTCVESFGLEFPDRAARIDTDEKES